MGGIFKVWQKGAFLRQIKSDPEHFSDDACMLEEHPEENQSYSGKKKKKTARS